jgi:hypothetical protein
MAGRDYHLRLLAREAGLAVWRVDGKRIRDALDVEFTNGHHHLTRAYVPENEIWLDRSAPRADESRFWSLHQVVERAALSAGASYVEALARANRAEKAARRRDLGEAPRRRGLVRRKTLGKVDGRTVVLVDGRAVRSAFDLNFTLGGHGYRYHFIPRSEIWIDDAVVPAERPAILEHEAVEVELMADGMAYDPAHAHASRAEVGFRRGRRVRYLAP